MHAGAGEQRVLAGRYLLTSRIGRGAMGTVWRARDPVLARDVAVKEIQVPILLTRHEREVAHQRTLREARAAARLNHPAVVTVFDVIEAEGNPWIVMELVQARSLEQVLAQEGPLPPGKAASAGAMVLAALSCAHAAGIMHRDVKPSNVLLSGDGRAVLTDFGIATLEGDPVLTQAGMVMGTPGFCAPERVRGEPATPASDLWSLGATLYAAVEGRGPFADRGAPMAVLAAVASEDAPPARRGGPLSPVISALLQRDPGQRPDAATAQRLLAAAAATGNAAAGSWESALAANPAPAVPRTSGPAPGHRPALAAHPAAAPTVTATRPAAAPRPARGQDAAPTRPARHAGPAGRMSGHHARAGAAGCGLTGRGRLRWRVLAAAAALVTGAGLVIGLLAGR